MRVAVTGATGFIGRHLVRELLGGGHDVVAIRRPSGDPARLAAGGVEVVSAPLDDEAAMAEGLRGCDAVVHLAGGGFADERATWEANADGTAHVLAACEAAGVGRVLLASTVTVTRAKVG